MGNKVDLKQLELFFIKEWCLTIMEFMMSYYKKKEIFEEFVDIVKNSFFKQDLRGIKYLYNDTNEWIKDLPDSEVKKLNQILYDKFKVDLQCQNNKDIKKIRQIVKRGKISNEDEYRLLLSRVEDIYDKTENQDEVEQLNRLLRNYP